MNKQYKITSEQAEELVSVLKDKSLAKYHLRVQAVFLRSQKKTLKEIAEITGYSSNYISLLSKKYQEKGLESLITDQRTSNNRLMTEEEETVFLSQFIKQAEQGEIITVKEMHVKYQEVVGKETSSWGFYRLLKRHNWRKLMPRPRHPKKASAQEIEARKKLTKKS